jgi:fucose permease
MLTYLLLAIIYLAFISLGLPDSLLGVSWPSMRMEFGLPLDAAGIISSVTIGVTVISSLANGYIIRKIGTGKLTFLSCLLTGGALFGIALVPSFWWIILMAIPLGFGAGSVDASLNNYVSHHFKAHHMNWLHSFWGVGATAGPIIMGSYLMNSTWRQGYKTIALIQLGLAFILLITLPLWKRHEASDGAKEAVEQMNIPPDAKPLLIKGVPFALATFLFYVAAEMSVGLWGSSYLVQIKGIDVAIAARWIALYFAGITIGRFISGFISFKLNNSQMIRLGVIISLFGAILMLLPLPNPILMASFVIIGLGFAPIFPSMIHETPKNFGKNNASVIIGFQMAAAYTGSAILPPLTGILYRNISMTLFPIFIVIFILLILMSTEYLNLQKSKTN